MKYMADGGIVGADGMTEAQRAKRNAALSSLGMSTAPAPVQPAQAAPLPQAPVQQPPVQAQDRPRGIFGIVGGRQQQIDKAAGYACGGKIKAHAQGGKISGPGTPTSDSIQAVVEDTGEQIRVANKERIVSQAQDQFLESVARQMGFDNLDSMLEAGTGKPVGPTIKGGKRAARYGANGEWIPDEIPKETNLSPLAGQTQAAVTPIAANQGRGVMDTPIGASFEKSIANFKAGVPQGSEITARPDVSAQQAASATGAQQTNPLVSGIQNTSPFVVAKERFPISVEGGQFITGSKPGEMPSSAQGGFTQDGKSYNVNQTSQPGISRVTASGTPPLITNTVPETAANQAAGMKSGQMRIGDGGFNLADQNERMAKSLGYAGADDFNSQWKARSETVRGGAGILGEVAPGKTQADLDNAEKTRRWRNDELVSLATRGNQGAIASLINAEEGRGVAEMGNETQRRNAELAAQVANNRDKLTMRGQDLNAQNELARLLGNPLDQQSKQLELKKQGIISGLFDKANSGDQEALAKYNALVNGSKEPNYSNRYITLPNRKTYNDMGQITGEEPGGVFDAKTGQLANFGKQGTGVNIEEANKIKAAVASGAMKREDAIKKLQAMGLQ